MLQQHRKKNECRECILGDDVKINAARAISERVREEGAGSTTVSKTKIQYTCLVIYIHV